MSGEKSSRRSAKGCKHFWYQIGGKPKWFSGHCLARCKYCPSWTVLEYAGEGVGPCHHTVLKEGDTLTPADLLMMYEESIGVEIPRGKRWEDLPR